jgi:hypothetical protein
MLSAIQTEFDQTPPTHIANTVLDQLPLAWGEFAKPCAAGSRGRFNHSPQVVALGNCASSPINASA